MTPQEQGRFCDSCQKCVVDFTGFTDEELHQYFRKNSGEKVCGRFQNWQLQRVVALPPEPRSRFYRWFISLGFVVFLSELLGTEAKAQEPVTPHAQKHKKQKPGAILGTILDEQGKPVKQAQVYILHTDGSRSATITDDEGNYVIKKITSGQHNLIVATDNYKKLIVKNVAIEAKRNTCVNAVLTKPTRQDDTVNYIEYTQPAIDVYGMVEVTEIK
ncbi:MAG: carboxypeptidase regulatory-like domain-containing protein [Taibaiella sp.]|nr:carboxypeptidase regulatory-like domain-containing protein [Taibaiella sp.]